MLEFGKEKEIILVILPFAYKELKILIKLLVYLFGLFIYLHIPGSE